ncbi:MAG: tRNA (guanosine(37)-N1)-methyltransferase TrmD [Candidatus Sumerlaeaceae bacterium]|nr:tRNA (guanosine(37)-N1)-methyltransferase TrmD [Candidatus Sumerlaeaceae bacterium]
MKIEILTLFPEMFESVFGTSIIKRAQEAGKVSIRLRNIRDFATDKHHVTDDTPYGGGPGMVMKPEPVAAAFDAISAEHAGIPLKRVYLSPEGRPWNQERAAEYASQPGVVLLCGHYEGIDERIRELYIDDEISMGDFVMTGGEIPAMAVTDSIVRLISGVLGNDESAAQESFGDSGLLDHPHYTRPVEFRGLSVPEVLLSGHHKRIEEWRRLQALERTLARRPDLIQQNASKLSPAERNLMNSLLGRNR